MALSTEAELNQVQEAIQALTTGGHSSYSIGGRSVTKLSLAELEQREATLLKRLARETGGGMFRGAKIMRPRT